MSRKDAMYFARQAERRARHEPSAQVMDMRYHIDALEAKLELLEKANDEADKILADGVAELQAKLERLEDIRRAAHNYINVRGVNNVKAANELRDALAALEGEQDG